VRKKLPVLKTDAEAERFVAEADLTQYDLSALKPAQVEFEEEDDTRREWVGFIDPPGPFAPLEEWLTFRAEIAGLGTGSVIEETLREADAQIARLRRRS
jgi:CopG antitoxin of type II toxin-antitoxin system